MGWAELDITQIGMTTPVGLSAAATAAAVRARISRLGLADCELGMPWPFTMARVQESLLPPLAPPLRPVVGLITRRARMLRLAAPALQQVAGERREPLALVLALPEPRPGGSEERFGRQFLVELEQQSGVPLDRATSDVLPLGRAGGVVALERALAMVASRRVEEVVVGGVDTFVDRAELRALYREQRLQVEDVPADARVPGEGAAFLRLEASGRSQAPLAQVVAVGHGEEAGHQYSESPLRGDGLAVAVRGALAGLRKGGPKVRCVYAGLTGESHWGKEWGVSYLRNTGGIEEGHVVEHPADCIGDAGAALGPILLGLAAIGLSRGYRKGPCLVWAGSDHAERAAALLVETPRE